MMYTEETGKVSAEEDTRAYIYAIDLYYNNT